MVVASLGPTLALEVDSAVKRPIPLNSRRVGLRPLVDVHALWSRRWLRPDSRRSRHCSASGTPNRSRRSVSGGADGRRKRRQRQLVMTTNSRNRPRLTIFRSSDRSPPVTGRSPASRRRPGAGMQPFWQRTVGFEAYRSGPVALADLAVSSRGAALGREEKSRGPTALRLD